MHDIDAMATPMLLVAAAITMVVIAVMVAWNLYHRWLIEDARERALARHGGAHPAVVANAATRRHFAIVRQPYDWERE